jgi:hypothetical protein
MIHQSINEAFNKMIGTSGIHKTIGITAGHVKLLRHQVRNGIGISLNKKIRLLQLSGQWDPDERQFTDQDMIDLVRFVLASTEAARALGPGYLFTKWKTRAGS